MELDGGSYAPARQRDCSCSQRSRPARRTSRRPPQPVAADRVTITHAFGETTIAEPPKRVVSAGFTGQDDLLALGIVPVAVTNWFGDQPFGVWPWAQPKLGDAKPVVLNLDNGIQVHQIAGLKPDLIVATDAGLDQDTYQKLAAIAPTLAQSDGDAFFEPWKDQAKAIGQAVYQSGQIDVADQRCRQRLHRRRGQVPAVQEQAGVAAAGQAARRQRGRDRPAGEPTFSPRWV